MKNPFKFLKLAAATLKLVRDPSQLNTVLAIFDGMEGETAMMTELTEAIRRTPEGWRALREQPRLPTIELQALRRLPEGTLGRVFAEHMLANGLDCNLFRRRAPRSPNEFVAVSLAETHDLWHVMSGFGVDMHGELGLQGFYLAQLPSRFAVLFMICVLLNTLLFSFDSRAARLRMIARGWVLGSRARPLFGVRWSDHWATPLSELRRAFSIDVDSADAVLPPAPGDERAVPEVLVHPLAHAA